MKEHLPPVLFCPTLHPLFSTKDRAEFARRSLIEATAARLHSLDCFDDGLLQPLRGRASVRYPGVKAFKERYTSLLQVFDVLPGHFVSYPVCIEPRVRHADLRFGTFSHVSIRVTMISARTVIPGIFTP